jgi:hypothetical protein
MRGGRKGLFAEVQVATFVLEREHPQALPKHKERGRLVAPERSALSSTKFVGVQSVVWGLGW